jgi:tetratricopeptide (TPR) repeat protein
MEDKIKICPFCREEISNFARKCRYCGEMVGDPLKDERTLTADDIGKPDVTGAVRGETLAQAYSALQHRLEEETGDAREKRRRSSNVRRVKKVVVPVLIVGGIVVALMVFRENITSFIGRFSTPPNEAHARAYLKDANEARRSGNIIEALRLTNEALRVHPEGERAQDELQDLRAGVKLDLERMYRNKQYDQVAEYAERILAVDPENQEVTMLANLAVEDKARYMMKLVAVIADRDSGKCTAAIRTKISGTVDVREGDTFLDMRVEKIEEENSRVFVLDLKRNVSLVIDKEGVFETNP